MMKLIRRALRGAAVRTRGLSSRGRYPWLPWWAEVRPESEVHPHVPAEHPEWFQAHNAGTTELEVLNWLHATVMLLKPRSVLETGAANGVGTLALASACRGNGFGVVHSVELDPALCKALESKLRGAGLARFGEVHCESSLDYLARTDTVFDIGFFDSMCEIRAEECRIALERGLLGRLAVFHDTSPLRSESLVGWPTPEEHARFRREVLELARHPRCTGRFESPLSRGVIALFFDPDPRP